MKLAAVSLAAFLTCLCTALHDAQAQHASSRRTAGFRRLIAKIEPLHQRLDKPQPGDWLAEHEETGQTFREYVRSKPVTPRGRRKIIYIQPLGEFSQQQREIVELSAEFLGLYYNRPAQINEPLPEAVIPEAARRLNPHTGQPQVLTTYVLNDVLRPRLPEDAAAYIAFTASDLWPGEGWNFVFGQASLSNRVGVWSIHRNGDPETSADAFRLCLRRTLKTATHETGHMFSIKHCTAWQCNMGGRNSLIEADRCPLYLCPECLAKVCWATRTSAVQRFCTLAEFCEKHGLDEERDFYRRSIAALEN